MPISDVDGAYNAFVFCYQEEVNAKAAYNKTISGWSIFAFWRVIAARYKLSEAKKSTAYAWKEYYRACYGNKQSLFRSP